MTTQQTNEFAKISYLLTAQSSNAMRQSKEIHFIPFVQLQFARFRHWSVKFIFKFSYLCFSIEGFLLLLQLSIFDVDRTRLLCLNHSVIYQLKVCAKVVRGSLLNVFSKKKKTIRQILFNSKMSRVFILASNCFYQSTKIAINPLLRLCSIVWKYGQS